MYFGGGGNGWKERYIYEEIDGSNKKNSIVGGFDGGGGKEIKMLRAKIPWEKLLKKKKE